MKDASKKLVSFDFVAGALMLPQGESFPLTSSKRRASLAYEKTVFL